MEKQTNHRDSRAFTAYWSFIIVSIQFFFFSHCGGVDLSQGKAVYLIFSVVLSLAFFGINGSKIPIKMIPLAILPMAALFKMPSIFSIPAIFQLIAFTAGIVLFFQVFTKTIDIKMLGWAFSIACIIQSCWVIANYHGYDFYALISSTSGQIKLSGGLGNKGFTGGFIGITAPFLIHRHRIWMIPLPLIAISLIHDIGTSSPALLLAFALASVVVIKCNKFKYMLNNYDVRLTVIAFATAALCLSGNSRWAVWEKTVSLGQWWYGRGFGYVTENFKDILIFKGEHVEELHNEFLEAIFALGPWSLILFVFAILAVWTPKREYELMRIWISACCILVHSVSWFPFHLGSHSIDAIFVFGILLKERFTLEV